jgi:signal peptidase I
VFLPLENMSINEKKINQTVENKPLGPPKSIFREYLESFVVTLVMAIFGMTFILQAVTVPTGSMQNYGVLTYSYKDKENARGWMNYIIGYINYYRLGKKDEALSYFYKAAQATSTTKTNPYLYQTFGSYYRDEVVRLGDEIVVKLKANNNQATDETKALIAMQKGYADRAVDAYARAYTVADKAPASKDYRDGLYGSLKEIYNLRYEGKRTDVDVYVNGLSSKPMPDPTTKVTPVAEEDPAATTTPTTPGTTTKPATTPTNPSTTKPATDDSKTPTKPVSSTTTKSETTKVTVTKTDNGTSTSEATTTKTKTPAKKPAPKKKGTR